MAKIFEPEKYKKRMIDSISFDQFFVREENSRDTFICMVLKEAKKTIKLAIILAHDNTVAELIVAKKQLVSGEWIGKGLNTEEKKKCAEEQIVRVMHNRRRELGRQFKEAAPPLFREYIYAATAAKYGDPLGPTFEMLREKKTYA